MTAPGSYILGLRQGRQQEREALLASTGIDIQRQRWIEDGVAIPSPRERKAYAKHFGFESLDSFDAGWRAKSIPLSRGNVAGRIPVINLAPAGPMGEYLETYPDSGIGMAYIDPPTGITGPNLFAFVILGQSMQPDYPDGYYAICRTVPAEEIVDGQAVFVRMGAARDHTCTFKRCFRSGQNKLELRPINPVFPTEIVDMADIDRMSPVIACIARVSSNDFVDIQYSDEHSPMHVDEGPG